MIPFNTNNNFKSSNIATKLTRLSNIRITPFHAKNNSKISNTHKKTIAY